MRNRSCKPKMIVYLLNVSIYCGVQWDIWRWFLFKSLHDLFCCNFWTLHVGGKLHCEADLRHVCTMIRISEA